MKHIFTLVLLLIPILCFCQFHIAVEANPGNDGMVNVRWKNNYVVTYTTNNWKTKSIINGQVTYEGYDDNGITFYTSYYQPLTFEKQNEAIQFARQFKDLKIVNTFNYDQVRKHNALKIKYDSANKKLCFRCKPTKNESPKPLIVK